MQISGILVCMYLNQFGSTKLSQSEATLTSSNWNPVRIVKIHLRFVFHRIWQCSKTFAEVESTNSKNATDHSGLVGARAEAATYCVGQARPITNSWDSSSPLPLPAVPATRPYLSALWVGTTHAHSVRSEQHQPAVRLHFQLLLWDLTSTWHISRALTQPNKHTL